MPERPTLDFIYFDAGGGHRSAATALKSVIEQSGYSWNIRLVNLQEILDPLDIFRKVTGIRLQDIYNLLLAKGWTLGSSQLLPLMHGVIRIYHPSQVQLLTGYWRETKPDMVVSLVPNFNRALYDSLHAALPEVPLVTTLTDLADYPPHFWIEKQPQYFICGTPRAAEQAFALGHPKERVFQTSGMILKPDFYEAIDVDRNRERAALGLAEDVPTCLVLFGGQGSNVMYSIAKLLGNAEAKLQLIMVCGRNESLAARIHALPTKNKIHVEGFTNKIPYFMHLSDFLIGKPGPGSISEAVQMKLPVIIERNAWTLPQERYNAQWIEENKLGMVLKNFNHIERAVAELLEPRKFKETQQRVGAIQNRAVFEIPEILARILQNH